MPKHNAKVNRQWPDPVRKDCKKLFLQHYDAVSISKQIGVPVETIRRWIYGSIDGTDWRTARNEFKTDLRDEFAQMRRDLVTSFEKSLKVHNKLCDKVTEQLDNNETLVAKDLRDLAACFKDACEVMLRMMGK